jgi:osmotically-inducible protein OsmY
MEDTVITGKVKAALAMVDGLGDSAISVETVNGRVVLTGKLANDMQRSRAIEAARSVDGVREVESHIEVSQG